MSEETQTMLGRLGSAVRRTLQVRQEAVRSYGTFRSMLGMYDSRALADQKLREEAVSILSQVQRGRSISEDEVTNRLDGVARRFGNPREELWQQIPLIVDLFSQQEDHSDQALKECVFGLYGWDVPDLGGEEDWIWAISKEPDIKKYAPESLSYLARLTFPEAQHKAESILQAMKDTARSSMDLSRESLVREILTDITAKGSIGYEDAAFVAYSLLRYPQLIGAVPDKLCDRDILNLAYNGVQANQGQGSTVLMGKIQDPDFAMEVIRGEIAENRSVNIISLSPDIQFTPTFNRELICANPVQALYTIPLREQGPALRLLAIARDPEAFFHIQDQAFCRDSFDVQLVNRLSSQEGLPSSERDAGVMEELRAAARAKLTELELRTVEDKLEALAEDCVSARQNYVFDRETLAEAGLADAFRLPETPENNELISKIAGISLKIRVLAAELQASGPAAQPVYNLPCRRTVEIFVQAGLGSEYETLRETASRFSRESAEFKAYHGHLVSRLMPVLDDLIRERSALTDGIAARLESQADGSHQSEKQVFAVTDRMEQDGTPHRTLLLTASEIDPSQVSHALYGMNREAEGIPQYILVCDAGGEHRLEMEVPSELAAIEPVRGADLGELAAFHFHEGVRQRDEKGEIYCFWDDADGSLDFNRSTQRFVYTSRDGGRVQDMTQWMAELRRQGCHFAQISNQEKGKMLAGKGFTTVDENNILKDFIPQRQADGTSRLMGGYARSLGSGAVGYATGKLRQQLDEAWNAGRI